jgi:hypothetical protein
MAERIDVDTIEPEEVPRLPDKEALLEPLNRFMVQVAGALNGGLTPGNFAVEERAVEVVAPEEWVLLGPSLLNGFTDTGATGADFAVRKTEGGQVYLRDVIKRAAGAPADGTVIAPLPPGYAPESTTYVLGFDTAGAIGTIRVATTDGGRLEFRSGNPTAFQSCIGSWLAADRTLPAWVKPVRVALGSAATPFPGRPKWVLVTAAVADDGSGVRVLPQVPSFSFTPATQQERALLSIPRINGLTPGVRYTLTLLVVAE